MKPHVRLKNTTSGELRAFSELVSVQKNIESDKALDCLDLCPVGSVLEDVVRIAADYTDLPPSIAYFSSLALIGARLTQEGFVCQMADGKSIHPNPWIITLAPSGCGKTLLLEDVSQFVLSNVLPDKVPDTVTAAALHQYFCQGMNDEDFSYRRCRSAFVRDEVGELFRTLKKESGEELRDQLLRTYGGSPLVRSTKKDGELRSPPVNLTFYGSAVDSSFFKVVDADDFNNGLMQRFQFILSHDRPEHRISWYSFKNNVRENARDRFDEEWCQILNRERVIKVTESAMRAFDRWFHHRFQKNPNQESYFRRAAFVSFKYSTIFAILSGSQTVDSASLTLALKVVDRHLLDLHRCMTKYTHVNDWHAILLRVEASLTANPGGSRGELLRGPARGISGYQLNIILQTLADYSGDVGIAAGRLLTQKRAPRASSHAYSHCQNARQSQCH